MKLLTLSCMLLRGALAGTEYRDQAPSGAEEAFAPRRIAVIVGIDRYSDPKLGDLLFAAKDATDLAAVLQHPDHGAFDQVFTLSGRASRDELREILVRSSAELQRDDTFLLYFAGHGTLKLEPRGSTLYLLGSESVLESASTTGIPLGEIEDFLDALPARHRVMLIDTCWSGGGRSALSPTTLEMLRRLRGPAPAPVVREPGRLDVHLFAAHHNQPAIEDNTLENGVYTHFFVQALEGAGDLDGDGLVDVGEAHEYARDQTMSWTDGLQVPWIQSTMVGRDQVFLAGDTRRRGRAERALLSGLDSFSPDALLRIDGRLRGGGALDPGPHRLEFEESGQRLLSMKLQVEAGDRLDIAELVRERGDILALGVEHELRSASDTIPPKATGLRFWWWPEDHGGSRPFLTLSTSLGQGVIDDRWRFLNGAFTAGAGFAWGRAFRLGPEIEAGLLWRSLSSETQSGLLLSPGLHMGLRLGPTEFGLLPNLKLFRADGAPQVLPGASISLAVRDPRR